MQDPSMDNIYQEVKDDKLIRAAKEINKIAETGIDEYIDELKAAIKNKSEHWQRKRAYKEKNELLKRIMWVLNQDDFSDDCSVALNDIKEIMDRIKKPKK